MLPTIQQIFNEGLALFYMPGIAQLTKEVNSFLPGDFLKLK